MGILGDRSGRYTGVVTAKKAHDVSMSPPSIILLAEAIDIMMSGQQRDRKP